MNMGAKLCFVISPIGERGSSTRRRADGVLTEIVRPALEPRGYRVERADDDKTPGVVTEVMIAKILTADLVVADLSGRNPNVMYELALRHASGRPVIQILEEGEQLPFDVAAQNTLYFAGDLAGRSEAVRLIQAAETAATSAGYLGNPVKQTVELSALSAGQDRDKVLANAIVGIQSELSRLRAEISSARDTSTPSPGRVQTFDEVVETATRVLSVQPWSIESAVLHRIGSEPNGIEEQTIREHLTKNSEPERIDRDEAEIEDAIQKYLRHGVTAKDQNGRLRLHELIAARIPRKTG